METLATYLIKSSVWLTGFALVYALFLRNERFFLLNRIYLISGILVSIIFPLFTWHYTVLLPVVPTSEVFEPQIEGIAEVNEPFLRRNVLLLFMYISGIAYLIFRILRQTLPVFHIIRKSEVLQHSSAKLIRTAEYPASFSFFSFVFVNPSISDTETNEIVNHELEHIRQQHWIDLLLFEILRTMQWFNPAIWLYGHLIRQNHEYLADEQALQRSSNPAIYRAALLNQMFGGPVISLANSFNYSLNKKRFTMMKQTISSPIRKLRLLLVLPLIAGVFYAFAAPEYKFIQAEELAANATQNEKTIKGKVSDEKGKPLKSASVVILGKTIGTMTDDNGNFMLKVTDDSPIMISYVGFESVKVNPDFEKEMKIILKGATISIKLDNKAPAAAKEEPLDIMKSNALIIIDGKETTKAELGKINPNNIDRIDVLKNGTSVEKYGEKGKDGVVEITSRKVPLYILDGKEINSPTFETISPETIESVSVLKDEKATEIYGEKAKNGVVLITSKNAKTEKSTGEVSVIGYGINLGANQNVQSASGIQIRSTGTAETSSKKVNDVFFIVEEMPEFPGGQVALRALLASSLKYPILAKEKGIQGKVFVNFVIAKDGSVTDAKIARSVDPLLDKEALRVVNNLPTWKPGKQGGEPVRVSYTVPVNFQLTEGSFNSSNPLIVKDGVVSPNTKMDDINPNEIESINVLKGESATAKYGEKGNNGVLEIKMKKAGEVFTMVEEMPQFPGGTEALKTFVYSSLKYPTIALENGIHGQVFVKFVVDKTGKVTNAKVSRGVDPSLDKEAKRIVESMPKWSPGKQHGQSVDVTYEIPVNFTLPANRPSKEKLVIGKSTTPKKEKKAVVETVQSAHRLIIVPNPAKDNAVISIENYSETTKLDVRILDIKGQLVKNETKSGPSFSMSFAGLEPGTYLVVVYDGTNQFSGQIVINQ